MPAGGGKGTPIVDQTFINSVPRVADGQVILGDGGRKDGEFPLRSSRQ